MCLKVVNPFAVGSKFGQYKTLRKITETLAIGHSYESSRVRPSRSVSKHTFSGSPIEALWTITQTMTMCSAFEHFMNGKGAI